MPISLLSIIYANANQGGNSHLFGVGHANRYGKLSSAELLNMNLHQTISSVTDFASNTCDATVILFAPVVPFITTPDFSGKFLQITNRKNSGSQLDVNLSSHGFNDLPTSVLAVAANRGFEFRLSFRDLFLDQWKTMLDAELSGGAKRNGNPTLTWEMWPQGISHLSANSMYLKVHQNLKIELHCWPDYEASITYHLYLYLDGAKHLRGYVARWAYWIEGGAKADEIEDKLRPAVISGMGTLNTQLAAQLNQYASFAFQDLYYLPGNQVTRPPTGVLANQFTTSDVTIVVQL